MDKFSSWPIAGASVVFNAITQSQTYVLDQDEAIDFYVGKLGLEITADVDMGSMRWLTVGVPGHPERQILLEKPGAPAMSEETAEQVREPVTRGAMGGWLILTADDCRKRCRRTPSGPPPSTSSPEGSSPPTRPGGACR